MGKLKPLRDDAIINAPNKILVHPALLVRYAQLELLYLGVDGTTKNKTMEEVIIRDKEKYLNDNHPTQNYPSLDFEVVCLHCNTIFKVGRYKVFKDEEGDEWICCANAPDCDGSAIDWIPLG